MTNSHKSSPPSLYLFTKLNIHGKAGRVDLTYWNRYIGADRFSERVGNVRLIGLDSNIYKYIEGSEADTEQKAWLESELAKGKKGEMTLVLAHHPFFLKSADEPEEYFNIKPDTRSYYRDLFRNAGVNAVICGHKHDNYVTADGDIPYITTSATGRPLGAAPSGVRVFVCEKGRLYHAYFTLDEIPGSRAELIDAVKNGSAAVPAPYGRFTDGEIGRINPEGWLREFLERQKSGLSGHPDAMSYPYNSCLWAGEISRNTESYGSDWWRYEQTAYYTDGLLRLGAITSIAGTKGLGAAPAYSATKRFQNTYIEALSQLASMKGVNVTFTDIRPGFVATDLLGDGATYPMKMGKTYVARKVVKAVMRRRKVVIVDWRYAILVFFWRLVPRCIWTRMKIASVKD